MKANEFSEYIRELRKGKHLTIRQVELYSGVSNSYLSQLENGKRGIPSPDILKKLYRPLGTTYENLLQKAGYLGERITDEKKFDFTEEEKALLDDPNLSLFFKEMKGTPEEVRKDMLEYLRFRKSQLEKENKD